MSDIQITTSATACNDPDLRYTNAGKAVASLRVAINHRKKQGDTWVDNGSTYFDLQAWDTLAEHLANSVRKGDRVMVIGRLTTETWTGKDGQERTTQRITADDIGLSMRFATVTATKTARRVPQQPEPSGWNGPTEKAPF